MKLLKCPEEIIELMHEYLDEEITPDQERDIKRTPQNCKECEAIFNELKKTIAFVKGTCHICRHLMILQRM